MPVGKIKHILLPQNLTRSDLEKDGWFFRDNYLMEDINPKYDPLLTSYLMRFWGSYDEKVHDIEIGYHPKPQPTFISGVELIPATALYREQTSKIVTVSSRRKTGKLRKQLEEEKGEIKPIMGRVWAVYIRVREKSEEKPTP